MILGSPATAPLPGSTCCASDAALEGRSSWVQGRGAGKTLDAGRARVLSSPIDRCRATATTAVGVGVGAEAAAPHDAGRARALLSLDCAGVTTGNADDGGGSGGGRQRDPTTRKQAAVLSATRRWLCGQKQRRVVKVDTRSYSEWAKINDGACSRWNPRARAMRDEETMK